MFYIYILKKVGGGLDQPFWVEQGNFYTKL